VKIADLGKPEDRHGYAIDQNDPAQHHRLVAIGAVVGVVGSWLAPASLSP
jgi:hypothetical protein